MNRRGVCYDVGRVMWGQDWRPEFSPEEARRELQIIRDDLHCNAVRICGQDPGRVMAAGAHALDYGLQVWLSPELWDHSPSETLDYIATAAEAAQDLHRHRPGQVVFSVGSEATLFMAGIVEGSSVFERLEHPHFWQRIQAGEHNGPLNTFLAEAAERGRWPLAEDLDLDADGGERRHVERVRGGAGAGEGHPEGPCRLGIPIMQEPEQQMISAEPAVAATARLLGCGSQHQLPGVDAEPLRHHCSCFPYLAWTDWRETPRASPICSQDQPRSRARRTLRASICSASLCSAPTARSPTAGSSDLKAAVRSLRFTFVSLD